MPMRREMDPAIAVEVAIDQPGQRGERQVEAVDRMGEQQRIAFGRLDAPSASGEGRLVGLEQLLRNSAYGQP